MTGFHDRTDAIRALLALSDVAGALEVLRLLPPLAGDASVTFTSGQLQVALEAYDRGDLSESLLERWAEALQGAEEIELDAPDEALLADALFRLSTPELFGTMPEIVAGLRDN